MSLFVHNWEQITDDPWILSSVGSGFKLEFTAQPFQSSRPAQIFMSKQMSEACDLEVESLLSKDAIRRVHHKPGEFLSSLFVVPKKGGSFRPIINLKDLNRFIAYTRFKRENLSAVRHLLRKDDWLVKLDLQDAYLTLPFHEDYRQFLRF